MTDDDEDAIIVSSDDDVASTAHVTTKISINHVYARLVSTTRD
jgi:hypothetical protein